MNIQTTCKSSVSWVCLLSWIVSLGTVLSGGCGRKQAQVDARPQPEQTVPQATRSSGAISDQSFRESAFEGALKTVRQAIEQGVEVNARDAEGRTALMMGSFNGHTDVVQLLLRHKARIEDRDSVGRTALLYAASGPNPQTVRVLLEAGADPNTVDRAERWTALMFAAAEGHAEVVRELLKHGANAQARDVDGETAHDFAASRGHDKVVRLLADR